MIKKNFALNKVEYSIVVGERNYLEYFVQYKTSTHHVRKRIYKGFQVSTDMDVLYAIALKHIAILENKSVASLEPPSQLHQYLENHTYRYKPKTVLSFTSITNKYVNWCKLRKIIPTKITPQQIFDFVKSLAEKKIHNNTIENNILVLKTIFNGMVKEQMCTENPFSLLPKSKRTPVSLMYFNDVQIKAIKEYCLTNNKQLWLAIHVIFSCFIRPGEMRMLQLYDMNLEDNFIEVKGEISKNGKTQKVVVNEQLKAELSILEHYPKYFYMFGKYGVPGAEPVSRDHFNKTHRKMLDALKIRGRYAFYSWKHTGVVKAVKAGINIKEIQLQLRHHSLDMVNEYLKDLGIHDNDNLKNKLPEL